MQGKQLSSGLTVYDDLTSLVDFKMTAQGHRIPRWISVEEGLPPKNSYILAHGEKLGARIDGPEVDICLWDGDELWVDGGTERAYRQGFTHWMLLPSKPKGQDDD